MMKKTTYRILADGVQVDNDTWATGLNNNDLIIGPSGGGKTRGYIMPNILQNAGSMVITDTKGRLLSELGPTLEQEGYQIQNLDFTDCLHSWGYNPLDYIRYDKERGTYNEQDIMTVAACIVPVETYGDPFWDYAARMLLEGIIGYVLECLPEEEHHLGSVVTLFRETGTPAFQELFEEICQLTPDSFAASRYKFYMSCSNAEKMSASIRGVLAEKLSILAFDGAKALYQNPQRIDIPSLGKKKTALFLTVSDTDRSMDKLANLFYTQSLHILCQTADQSNGHRLPVPVRFLLDDFAANVCIPDFDKIISVIRSREISVSLVLQSISQLESLYGSARAKTIMNNCDHCLYLGGQDVETARYISVKANKSVNTVLDMPVGEAWLFTRGQSPQRVTRYDIDQHPRHKAA
ncbi:MAG: type IV secretory system conjugative DNA transfer family protein [Oscillospiraceae bacterium]|nr:type IV secretory system conjugative DNA transfer family protein [Oscillospiraceae bacterium]